MGRLIRNTVLYNVVFIGLGNVLQIFFADPDQPADGKMV